MPFVPAEARGGSPDTCCTWHEQEQAGSKPPLLWHLRRVEVPSLGTFLPHYELCPLLGMLPRQQQATKAVALGTALRGTSGGRRSRDGTAGGAGMEPQAPHQPSLRPLGSHPAIRLMRSSGAGGPGAGGRMLSVTQ